MINRLCKLETFTKTIQNSYLSLPIQSYHDIAHEHVSVNKDELPHMPKKLNKSFTWMHGAFEKKMQLTKWIL